MFDQVFEKKLKNNKHFKRAFRELLAYKDKVTGAEKYANVQIGHLYQATKQKIERLKQSAFKVLEMWEHKGVCDCKKNKVNPQRFSFVLSHSISTLL